MKQLAPLFPNSSLLSRAGTLPWSFLSQPPSHHTHQVRNPEAGTEPT